MFLTAAQALAAQTPVSKVSGTNTICASLTATCKVGATNPCPSFLCSGTVTQFFAITPQGPATEAQVCAATLTALAAKQGVTVTALCTTSNCNAPTSSGAAVAMPKALLLVAVVVALGAVVM